MSSIVKSHSVWAIIIACGKSEQLAPDVDVAFLQLGDQPILTYSLLAFEQCEDIEGIVVVASKERLDSVVGMARMFGTPKLRKIVVGGQQRTVSIKAGLGAIDEDAASLIVVHEASRPCITARLVSDVVKTAKRYGVAVAAEKLDTPVAQVPKGLKVAKPVDANGLWSLQMPIAAKRDKLEQLLGMGKSKAKVDDASFAGKVLKGAYMVQVERPNLRIAQLSDIQLVSTIVRN